MAIEPLGSKFSSSQKAPVSKKDAGALAHTEGSTDGSKVAGTESVGVSKKAIEGQTLSKEAGVPDANLDTKVLHGADKHESRKLDNTELTQNWRTKPELAAVKVGLFSLTNASARATHILEALSLPVTEASRRAVLIAMAEGLKLTPKLIRGIMRFMKEHPDEDVQSCVLALAEDDEGLLGLVLALLGTLRDSGAPGDRPRTQDEAGELAEEDEREAIKVQAKQLFANWLRGGGAEELAKYREPGFVWIQLPFSFSQGALDLTGYIRMLYTYSERAVTRVVLDCANEAGRRLAVFEKKRSLFWSSVRDEENTVAACGIALARNAEEAEASALCGIDSVYKE